MDRTIGVLPPEIASRIAAGEVIERPASVVKELVENSLDAGAMRIEIILEDGGKQLIQVSDDGEGMTPEQARLSIQRHATSKIRTADDLYRLSTYGFRGEALPSIASVSEFQLITSRADSPEPYRLLVVGGILKEEGAFAASTGTTVRVERLFENVPARLKFMKSSATELSRALDYIQRLCLARPEVSVSLKHAAQENFHHAGGDDISALASVFGRAVTREFLPVHSPGSITIRGYLAPPTRTRANRQQQYVFVNGRPVANRSLSHAIDEAYSGLLPHGRFPVVVIHIDIPPDQVDVNVHPRKAEVKFIREHDVHSLVFHTVRDALVQQGLVPRIAPSPLGTQPDGAPMPSFTFEPVGASLGSLGLAPPSTDAFPTAPHNWQQPESQPAAYESEPAPSHPADQRIDMNQVRILGQIAQTYIVLETPEGMAIIDQHVAHERVLYERFRKRAVEQPIQYLAVPVTLELTRREALIVTERLKEFQELGFEMEPFGPDTILLRGVPAGLKMKKLDTAIRDMIEELVELTLEKKMLAPREAVITSAACKASVKAGDWMSEPDMRGLIQQLMECENPYVCPHGRPIIVRLDRTSLEKIFQR